MELVFNIDMVQIKEILIKKGIIRERCTKEKKVNLSVKKVVKMIAR